MRSDAKGVGRSPNSQRVIDRTSQYSNNARKGTRVNWGQNETKTKTYLQVFTSQLATQDQLYKQTGLKVLLDILKV